MNKIDLVRDYLVLICSFSTDPTAFLRFVQPSAQWVEYPNAVTPQTKIRDLAATLQGAQAGRKLLGAQTITVENWFESGDQLVVEGLWTGTVAADVGKFHQGQTLVAHLAMVFTFEDGKIARQVNYDCYQPF